MSQHERSGEERRLARKLREFDERREAGADDAASDGEEELTPAEQAELRKAKQCLAWLDEFRDFDLPGQPLAGDTMSEMVEETHGPASLASVNDSVKPTRIGRFEIIRRLGSGGFGVVFLARDPKLERKVALKLPRAETLLSDSAHQRFLREARMAAVLSHPAIVPIFESGQQGPIAYIAYAYCRGTALDRWLAQRDSKCPAMLACRIVARLAAAVQHAHLRGVIHRDLKPANVLIDLPDGDEPTEADDKLIAAIRVTDFGLAKFHSQESVSQTHSGAMVGTPAYMSPEQARLAGDVGPATDIYSLGAILYQLLTGHPPHASPSPAETIHAILNDDPVPPRRLNRTLPRDIDSICLKCLEKEAHRRYATAQDLENDLLNFVAHRPVVARRTSALERTWRWRRRNPVLAMTSLLLILVLVAGVATSTVLWRSSEHQRGLAKRHEDEARRQAEEARRQSQQLRRAVDQLLVAIADEPSLRSAGMEPFRRQLMQAASGFYEQFRSESPQEPALRVENASILLKLAALFAALDDLEATIDACRRVQSMLAPDRPSEVGLVLEAHARAADALTVLGRLDEARRERAEAIRLASDGIPHDVRALLLTQWIEAAADSNSVKDFITAREQSDRALQIARDLFGPDPGNWPDSPLSGQVLVERAFLLAQTGSYEEAQRYVDWAARHLPLGELPDLAAMTDHLSVQSRLEFVAGLIGSHTGEFEQAEIHWGISRKIDRTLADRHPQVGGLLDSYVNVTYSFALVQLFQNDLVAAAEAIDDGLAELAAGRETFTNRSRSWTMHEANLLNLQYAVLRRQDDVAGARHALERAISLIEGDLSRADMSDHQLHSLLGNFQGNLGFLESRLGNFEESVRRYRLSIEILEPIALAQQTGEATRWLINAYLGCAAGLNRLQRYGEALEVCQSMLSFSPADPAADLVRRSRVVLLARLGRCAEADEALTELVRSGQESFRLATTAAECADALADRLADDPNLADHPRWCDSFAARAYSLAAAAKTDGSVPVAEILNKLDDDQAFAALRRRNDWQAWRDSIATD